MSDRFGFDASQHQPLEASIRWATQNSFRYIDFNADNPPNDKVRLNDNRGDYVLYAQFRCFRLLHYARNFDSLNQTFLKNEPSRL